MFRKVICYNGVRQKKCGIFSFNSPIVVRSGISFPTRCLLRLAFLYGKDTSQHTLCSSCVHSSGQTPDKSLKLIYTILQTCQKISKTEFQDTCRNIMTQNREFWCVLASLVTKRPASRPPRNSSKPAVCSSQLCYNTRNFLAFVNTTAIAITKILRVWSNFCPYSLAVVFTNVGKLRVR